MSKSQEDQKRKILQALEKIPSAPFYESARDFLQALGYSSPHQQPLVSKTFDGFQEEIVQESESFSKEKAMGSQWKSVDFLFQLSQDCLQMESEFPANSTVDNSIMHSYLFFAIELEGESYTRTQLATVTRQINKLFLMPALILFRHGETITLSIIDRRLHKRDSNRDVLEKVTLIKDIRISSPHRAHLEILFELSLDRLRAKSGFSNFVELHEAWRSTLNTRELNKQFYKELSEWYFWALNIVHFPGGDSEGEGQNEAPDTKMYQATHLIRLLTRLLFVWFIREKGLVPEQLFDERYLQGELLKDFHPAKKTLPSDPEGGSKYYKAVLQNLFFATLNKDREKREFRRDGQNMNATTLMRYRDSFQNPEAFLELVNQVVPFLNGGLFECLDHPHPEKKGRQGGAVIVYRDGFSDRKDNELFVPDYLFFGLEEEVNLVGELGEGHEKEKVRGLFHILKSYKFTVAENTPIEEDIALDPELLGKVFENLLASYNPETSKTARNQTGSFYTPREIVNYMVNETLLHYLSLQLVSRGGTQEKQAKEKLEILLGFNDSDPGLNEKQINVLIEAIDGFKILDPACGSGAYPMGILHQLVHVLHRLDPRNTLWKERQVKNAQAIEDSEIRQKTVKDIEKAFQNNELDYGRKLFLIENVIFGVDLQPIAIQIARLRFFISLIVEQKSNPDRSNFGIRPLPNLETRFVAANTLVSLKKPTQMRLTDSRLADLQEELQGIRHQHFSAKTPKTKRKLRERDHEVREHMKQILLDDGWPKNTAQEVANWDPYAQNQSCPFFDPVWMFGVENGFHAVIGNPPYIQLQKLKGTPLQETYKEENFQVHDKNGDVYCLFFEKGMQLLKEEGSLYYITSNKWMRTGYGEKLRTFFSKLAPRILVDLGPNVFETATVDTNLLMLEKTGEWNLKAISLSEKNGEHQDIPSQLAAKGIRLSNPGGKTWFIGKPAEMKLQEKIQNLGKPLKEWDVSIFRGVLTGLNEAFIIDTPTRDRILQQDPRSGEIIKPLLRGRDIRRYGYEWGGRWLIGTFPSLNLEIKDFPGIKEFLSGNFDIRQLEQKGKKYPHLGFNGRKKTSNAWFETQDSISYWREFLKPKIIWKRIGSLLRFSLDEKGFYPLDSTAIMSGEHLKFICAFLNGQVGKKLLFDSSPKTGTGDLIVSVQAIDPVSPPPVNSMNLPKITQIETLVDQILEKKKVSLQEDTTKQERQIDQLVYELYELTDEEIQIIEGKK